MSQRSTTRPVGGQGIDRWTALTAGLVACALAVNRATIGGLPGAESRFDTD